MKINKCPEGHQCTSDCRREGCPCHEHAHNEEEAMNLYQVTIKFSNHTIEQELKASNDIEVVELAVAIIKKIGVNDNILTITVHRMI